MLEAILTFSARLSVRALQTLRLLISIALIQLIFISCLQIEPVIADVIVETSHAPAQPAQTIVQEIVQESVASTTPDGAALFELHCAGCHIGGGNIIRRGKNLKLKTLEKNQLATPEAIAALVSAGKGNMSAYADRLSPAEINTVSQYVLTQAQQGWK